MRQASKKEYTWVPLLSSSPGSQTSSPCRFLLPSLTFDLRVPWLSPATPGAAWTHAEMLMIPLTTGVQWGGASL